MISLITASLSWNTNMLAGENSARLGEQNQSPLSFDLSTLGTSSL